MSFMNCFNRSRYIVKKSNDSDENEVEFISKSIKNIPSDEILFFDWEDNNAALFVDVTEIKMSYGELRNAALFFDITEIKMSYGELRLVQSNVRENNFELR